MVKTWVYSDPHFGHDNICKFTDGETGEKLRPWANAAEMDIALIYNWNSRVADADRVYLLGDVAMSKKGFLGAVPLLRGRIVLVPGNHDTEKMSFYKEHFDDVRGYVVKKGIIMSHIPIHPESLGRWQFNVHGHLHKNRVLLPDGTVDERYINVCVEQTEFAPMDFQLILDRVKHG